MNLKFVKIQNAAVIKNVQDKSLNLLSHAGTETPVFYEGNTLLMLFILLCKPPELA